MSTVTSTVRPLYVPCAKPQLLATLDDVAHKAALLGRAGTKRTNNSKRERILEHWPASCLVGALG